jgi:anti-anti-sigma factor
MDNDKVLHATRDEVHVLRFIGNIRYPMSPSIDHFLQRILSESNPAGFIIDLTETESIDSTNLGLLARLAGWMRAHDRQRITIVSNRADINSLLNSMALDEVFDIIEDTCLETDAEREVPQQSVDKEALSRTLIKTHRALMDLNEHNRKTFEDVVSALEKNETSRKDS